MKRSESVANILANIMYGILLVVYYLVRLFTKGKIHLDTQKAKVFLNSISPKPQMDYSIKGQMQKKDLSIIVPAFNSEKTIEKCIESVINQKTKYDYELVIINDGSSDNTQTLVEKYDNPDIILVNQDNMGFSGARNRGIDESTGKYLMFLDSDDYLIDNCIDSMMDEITNNKTDIVQASYSFVYEESNEKKDIVLTEKAIEEDKEEITLNPGYPWAKIYKRKLFEKIRFPLDVWFEDTITCMLLFRICSSASVMSKIVYGYRINPDGITQRARNNNKCIDHYWVMEHCLEKAKELGLPNDDLQYELVKKHMSTLLYRRIAKMDEETKKCAFILASEMLNNIRPNNYKCKGNRMEKDLEKAFSNGYYKLWKLASFIV